MDKPLEHNLKDFDSVKKKASSRICDAFLTINQFILIELICKYNICLTIILF